MTTALLDPDTRESLRSQAGRVEGLVGLGVEESPAGDEELTQRLTRRWEWYLGLEDSVRDLVQALPAGVEDYEARQLLVFLTTLRRAVESDAAASDADSTVQLAAMQVGDIARRLERRLEHAALEDADEAASYVFAQLGSVGATELARLLGRLHQDRQRVALGQAGQAEGRSRQARRPARVLPALLDDPDRPGHLV